MKLNFMYVLWVGVREQMVYGKWFCDQKNILT